MLPLGRWLARIRRTMKTTWRLLAAALGALAILTTTAAAASAQVTFDPTHTPSRNTGGVIYTLGIALTAVAAVIGLVIVVAYMMRAPNFARAEEGLKVVRADRVRPGMELPRRAVDVSQASAILVAPPAVPTAQPVAVAASPVAVAAASAPAPAAATAPAPVPAPVPAPAAEAPAAAPTPPPVAAPAAPVERPEVALDQATFDRVLAELLEKGTDRRVAEGQARRAAMIAARKAAEG